MKSLVMEHKFMAQFVSIVSLLHHKEVVTAVSYPMLLIQVLTRGSVLSFVSLILNCCEGMYIILAHIALYTVQFGFRFDVEHVTISPSTGSATAGQTGYSLTCSSTLFEPSRLPSDLPSPNFQWSFNGSASLPSGVTATTTVRSSSNSTSETYASILQFSSLLSQSLHTGMYTCRLGPERLVNSAMVTVNGKF